MQLELVNLVLALQGSMKPKGLQCLQHQGTSGYLQSKDVRSDALGAMGTQLLCYLLLYYE